MKILPTQAELNELLEYFPLTGELFWKARPRSLFKSDGSYKSWHTKYANKPAFTAIDAKGYYVGGINDAVHRASRVIFKLYYGVDPIQVDHEDRDRKNNRIKNLRNVSGQDNQKNMKKAINNTSGVTGVSWNTEKQAWDVSISKKRIGRYKVFADAVAVRKQAEIVLNYHPNHGT